MSTLLKQMFVKDSVVNRRASELLHTTRFGARALLVGSLAALSLEMGFFTCSKCGSLSGGIFGKGPTRHYRSDTAARCVHDWCTVAKPEFQKLATDRFGVDWSRETNFWFAVAIGAPRGRAAELGR